MAEFDEIVEQFKRMCGHYENCDECPLLPIGKVSEGKDRSDCMEWSFKSPSVFQHKVMKWAAGHPEPVYPTWYEWLTNIGAVTRKVEPYVASILIDTGLLDPIPADFAQMMGIEPKEA